jgi:hypothetical protein
MLWLKDPHHLNKQTDQRVFFTVSSLVYKYVYKSSINVLCLHLSSMFCECFYTIPILASQAYILGSNTPCKTKRIVTDIGCCSCDVNP